MTEKKSIWFGVFTHAECTEQITLRKLHFKNVRNEKEEIVKTEFSIIETKDLKAIGLPNSMKGQLVSFVINEESLEVENFCYPHDSREETYIKIQREKRS